MDAFEDGNLPVVIEAGSVRPSSVAHAPPGDDGLTDLQRSFVDAYCRLGDGTAAAIEAGYGGGARNMATRNLLKPKIQAEIERRVRAGRGSVLLKATERLLQIIEGSSDERAVVQAALGMMDRFGLAPPRGPAVQVNNVVMNGSAAQQVLAEVMAKREERLARSAPAAIDHEPL